MVSMVYASASTFVGAEFFPSVDTWIKIVAPIIVGVINHLVELHFKRKEERKKKAGL